jgi:sugar O-acyltransferase (sialic acid O-acetyltransferase NeuD family)
MSRPTRRYGPSGRRVSRRAPEPLVLVGPGGFGRETAELVRAINDDQLAQAGEPPWDLLGFLDDDPSRHGTSVSGTRVLGGLDELGTLPDARVVVCTGHPGDFTSKKRIVERLALPPERYATLVHPSAVLPASCRIGEGTVVLAGVVATTEVEIGAHVGAMPQTVLTHDDRLGDFVTVGAGVRLAGTVQVHEGAYLGSGCLIRENCEIGPWALIGMGAVVTRDIPGGEVWAGVPARFLRRVVEQATQELGSRAR